MKGQVHGARPATPRRPPSSLQEIADIILRCQIHAGVLNLALQEYRAAALASERRRASLLASPHLEDRLVSLVKEATDVRLALVVHLNLARFDVSQVLAIAVLSAFVRGEHGAEGVDDGE
jgi:hypothetical protein